MTGAGIVFFAYIGFDAVSTAAQGGEEPTTGHAHWDHRLVAGLHAVLYIAVSAIATGIVPYALLDVPDPDCGGGGSRGSRWMSRLIKLAPSRACRR
jgi:APA family basic amino acid/polyamine antiporter